MLILAIETSCDDTSAAVVEDGMKVLSSVVSSQVDVHAEYGGVVPELACRKHIENVGPVIRAALKKAGVGLKDLDALAATVGPGLVGALLVGLNTAKAMAYALKLPLVGVNHLEGHILSIMLEEPDLPFPFISLVVSGGHTDLYLASAPCKYELLGRTRDDAAGEAFDKVAKMLGLGYPGGPIIDRMAKEGNPESVSFPQPRISPDTLDFSFSGLKTAVFYFLRDRASSLLASDGLTDKQSLQVDRSRDSSIRVEDVLAGFQRAAVSVLVAKTLQAAEKKGVKRVVTAGGVAANSALRRELSEAGRAKGIEVYHPSPWLCTDNAAMAACAAYFNFVRSDVPPARFSNFMELDAVAALKVGESQQFMVSLSNP